MSLYSGNDLIAGGLLPRTRYTAIIVGLAPVVVTDTTGIPTGFNSALSYTDSQEFNPETGASGTTYFRIFRTDGAGEEIRLGTINGTTVHTKTY